MCVFQIVESKSQTSPNAEVRYLKSESGLERGESEKS